MFPFPDVLGADVENPYFSVAKFTGDLPLGGLSRTVAELTYCNCGG